MPSPHPPKYLKGHQAKVSVVQFLPRSQRVLTGSWDKTIRVWDVATGDQVGQVNVSGGKVYSVCVSDDETCMFVGSSSTIIDVFAIPAAGVTAVTAVAPPQSVYCFAGHRAGISALALSPTSPFLPSSPSSPSPPSLPSPAQWLVSGSWDRSIRVWDISTGSVMAMIRTRSGAISCLKVFGTYLASGGEDGMIRIWNTQTWTEMVALQGHTGWISDVCFSPHTSDFFASAGMDGIVKVWHIPTPSRPQLTAELTGHQGAITSIAFLHDDNRVLISAGKDGTLRQWNVHAKCEIESERRHAGQSIDSSAASPHLQHVCVARASDFIVRLESSGTAGAASSNEVTRVMPDAIPFHAPVWGSLTTTSGQEVQECGEGESKGKGDEQGEEDEEEKSEHKEDCEEGEEGEKGEEGENGRQQGAEGAEEMDGAEEAEGAEGAEEVEGTEEEDDYRVVIDIDMNDPTTTMTRQSRNIARQRILADGASPGVGIRSIRFARNASDMFAATGDEFVGVYRMSNTNHVCTFRGVGHTGPVHAAVLTMDGECVVSVGEDATVRVWHIETGLPMFVLYGHTGPIVDLDITPSLSAHEGSGSGSGSSSSGAQTCYAVTASLDCTARVWSLADGTCRHILTHAKSVLCVRTFPSGAHVALGGADNDCVVHNLESGELLCRFQGHTYGVYAVEVSRNEQYVFTGSGDHTIRMWEMLTGTCKCVLVGHATRITHLQLCANRQILCSMSKDGQLCMWSVPKGQLLQKLQTESSSSSSPSDFTVAPNEQTLIVARNDSTLAEVYNNMFDDNNVTGARATTSTFIAMIQRRSKRLIDEEQRQVLELDPQKLCSSLLGQDEQGGQGGQGGQSGQVGQDGQNGGDDLQTESWSNMADEESFDLESQTRQQQRQTDSETVLRTTQRRRRRRQCIVAALSSVASVVIAVVIFVLYLFYAAIISALTSPSSSSV